MCFVDMLLSVYDMHDRNHCILTLVHALPSILGGRTLDPNNDILHSRSSLAIQCTVVVTLSLIRTTLSPPYRWQFCYVAQHVTNGAMLGRSSLASHAFADCDLPLLNEFGSKAMLEASQWYRPHPVLAQTFHPCTSQHKQGGVRYNTNIHFL
ncbi:hypothetical protein BC826DRAFT_485501 [Russula brevipes]|nr:hypothetical protein BC826DRAFT_485501 [Russula brevipes]